MLRATGTAFVFLIAAAAVAQQPQPTVDSLLEKIRSGDAAAKAQAIDELANFGKQASAATPVLLELLSKGNEDLRWRAARTLGAIKPNAAKAVIGLSQALKDKSGKVRAYAAFALGELGESGRPAAAALINAAFDKDPLVRRAVLEALREINPPQSQTLPVWLKVLKEAHPPSIHHVIQSIVEDGASAVPNLITALDHPEACYWVCIILGEIGPEAKAAVPHLKKVLTHQHPETRIEALMALGAIGQVSKNTVSSIVKTLKTDKEAAVRYAAVYALGQIGDKSATSALKPLLKDKDAFLKMVAAWALAKMHPNDQELQTQAINAILAGLQADDVNLQSGAARALAELNAPPELVAPKLVEALRDADEEVVGNALDALAGLGAKVVPRVAGALENKDLRPYALRILARLGPEAKEATPALIKAASDKDPQFKRNVLFTLGSIGSAAKQATPTLIKLLSDRDKEVRYAAVYALGRIGPSASDATEALRLAARANDPFMRLSCVWALVKIHPKNRRVIAVAVPLLSRALEHERENVREEAARTLGEIGTPAKPAIGALEKRLDDSDENVRQAAAQALKQIQAGDAQ